MEEKEINTRSGNTVDFSLIVLSLIIGAAASHHLFTNSTSVESYQCPIDSDLKRGQR
jgi:hypothetical protein